MQPLINIKSIKNSLDNEQPDSVEFYIEAFQHLTQSLTNTNSHDHYLIPMAKRLLLNRFRTPSSVRFVAHYSRSAAKFPFLSLTSAKPSAAQPTTLPPADFASSAFYAMDRPLPPSLVEQGALENIEIVTEHSGTIAYLTVRTC